MEYTILLLEKELNAKYEELKKTKDKSFLNIIHRKIDSLNRALVVLKSHA